MLTKIRAIIRKWPRKLIDLQTARLSLNVKICIAEQQCSSLDNVAVQLFDTCSTWSCHSNIHDSLLVLTHYIGTAEKRQRGQTTLIAVDMAFSNISRAAAKDGKDSAWAFVPASYHERTGTVVETESRVRPLGYNPQWEVLHLLGPVAFVAVQHLGRLEHQSWADEE